MRRRPIPGFLVPLALGLIWAGGLAVGSSAAQAKAPAPGDPWARLTFLVGEWRGVGTGAPGEAVGGSTFAFGLDKKVLVRKNWATYLPKPGETAGLSHEDLMIVYPGSGGTPLRAIYFDNEGHVISYAVTFPKEGNAAFFETDPGLPGPRFRLTYELKPDGLLDNAFLIAPPGGEFKVYVSSSLRKK
jgi:hypothetical protein